MANDMSIDVTAHIRPDTTIAVRHAQARPETQWLSIDEHIALFVDDTELARLRDVITAHLDSRPGEA